MSNEEDTVSHDNLTVSILKVLAPKLREGITNAIIEDQNQLIEQVVTETLAEVRAMLEDGVCTFDFHVIEIDDLDAQGNCKHCSKHTSEHRTVLVCQIDDEEA